MKWLKRILRPSKQQEKALAPLIRRAVLEVERRLVAAGGDSGPKELNHFADGLYAREIHLKAGTVFASKIHKYTHFLFVLSGRCQVVDEHYGAQEIVGPAMIKTLPLTKRAVRVLEDSVWITVHATDETDVDEIEKQIIAPDFGD